MTGDFEELSVRIERLRAEHDDVPLRRADLDPDPIVQFGVWLAQALGSDPGLPNSMTLATADAAGLPSARIVLLKGVDEQGFTFFTNYASNKARDLDVNPHAALVFHWPALERQVRVVGPVVKMSRDESAEYFVTRPLRSRLGAWASAQSAEIESRDELERKVNELEQRFGNDVPMPDGWGGYRLTPTEIEFWKARADRLHDRFLYRRAGDSWTRTRLAP